MTEKRKQEREEREETDQKKLQDFILQSLSQQSKQASEVSQDKTIRDNP